jgi:hypothetical protein
MNCVSISRGFERPKCCLRIDHTDALRKLGRDLKKSGSLGVACAIYPTWVEHTLNYIVSVGVQRRGFGNETAKQIIREVRLPGKLTWLLPLLGFRPLNPTHRETLNMLAQKRNEFVHYKWAFREGDPDPDSESLFPKVEKALQYLARYRSAATLHGAKSRIKKAAGEISGRSGPGAMTAPATTNETPPTKPR